MSQSDLIAIGALIVALLSAFYARWAANEAKKANKISLHFKMVEIYEEVLNFSDCFRGIFTVPSATRLEQFRTQGLQRSEIYFSERIHKQLQKIYSHCSESEVWLKLSQDKEKTIGVEVPNEIEIRSDYKSILKLLYPVLEQMRAEIKLKIT